MKKLLILVLPLCSVLCVSNAAHATDGWDLSGAFQSNGFVPSGSSPSLSRTAANTLPTIAGMIDNSDASSIISKVGGYAKILAKSQDRESNGIVGCRNKDQLGAISEQNASKYGMPSVDRGF